MALSRLQKCFNRCDNIRVGTKVSVLVILEQLGAACLFGDCLFVFGGVFCCCYCCFQNKFSSSEVYLWLMLKMLKVLLLSEAKKAHNS